jgi:zinc/manganese transport system substrate-binding protein
MTFRTRILLPVCVIAAAPLALAGCASDGGGGSDATTLQIVASTNVYGDIAATVAGDAADVTSIIHDASQDPHEYEATPRDALAIADADLVVVNGGGYDEFMHTLLEAHDNHAVVVDAVELSGLEPDDHDHAEKAAGDDDAEHDHHDHGEFNEHVWYSFGAMAVLAEELAAQLAELDPADADTFAANAQAFAAGLDELTQRASGIAEAQDHTHVAITEPVPLYLLEAAGLENVSPEEFSEAVEEGTDAPALVLQEVVELVADGSVAFLAYNEQTVGPQTEQVLASAQQAGTPVVSFTELLPEGEGYLGWMGANLDAIERALG